MNGILGRPYRVFYTAKNIQSGLSGIVANVLRPDGSIVGPFNLIEIANSNFSGVYYFDYLTTQLMPEGEYLITVKEGSYKSPLKVSFQLPTTQDAVIDNQKINGKILTIQRLVGELRNDKVIGRITSTRVIGSIASRGDVVGVVRAGLIVSKILTNKITGKILC